MPTKNPRVNITLEPNIIAILSDIAEEREVSIASVAKDLILQALEISEDVKLSHLAEIRDVKGAKRVSHKNAWR